MPFLPEEYLTGGKDWIRAGRRRFMLLNAIYYLQQMKGEEKGVSRDDITKFLGILKEVDNELYSTIIKPKIPLEYTLKQLITKRLIHENTGCVHISIEL